MNEVQIFKSDEFGEIRTLNKDGEPWFAGKDIARALGYKYPALILYPFQIEVLDLSELKVLPILRNYQELLDAPKTPDGVPRYRDRRQRCRRRPGYFEPPMQKLEVTIRYRVLYGPETSNPVPEPIDFHDFHAFLPFFVVLVVPLVVGATCLSTTHRA